MKKLLCLATLAPPDGNAGKDSQGELAFVDGSPRKEHPRTQSLKPSSSFHKVLPGLDPEAW
jgi:hypothetical protein